LRETPAVVLEIWLLVVVIALSIQLGGYPLYDADEGRNAEVAREMAATNDYVLPRLDTLPYLDKPVVYFAAEAAAMEVLGPTETAARLPSLLFTFATAGVLWWFARRWWSGEEAWTTAIIFLSMPLTMAFARTVIFDSALTFFVVLAIIAFYLGIEEDRRWSIVAWVSIAFGVLTKGPVAIILPLFVAVPYAFRRKRSRAVWPILGIVAFVVVIAPWVWAVTRVIPDFLQYVFVTETAQRLTTGALKRTGPPWYFIPYILGGAMPWSILALGMWWRAATLDEGERMNRWFLLLWILVPFVFFSLSQSKRPQYILPIMPAIALLLAREWTTRPRIALVRAAAATIGVFGVILMFSPLFLHRARMKPEVAIAAHEVVVPLGLCFAAGGIIAFLFARDRRVALAALSIPVIAIPLVANPLMRGIGEARSTKTLVLEMRPRLTATTRVVGVEAFAGSLAFYLRRPLVVITPDAEELTSNYLVRHYDRFANDVRSTIRPPSALEAEMSACCEQRIYIVRNNDAANRSRLEQQGMRRIAEGSRFVAYEQPVK